MVDTKEKIREELKKLIEKGLEILEKEQKKNFIFSDTLNHYPELIIDYQTWYTSAISVVKRLLPSRLDEFIDMYKGSTLKMLDVYTYRIEHYLTGFKVHTTSTTRRFSPEKSFGMFKSRFTSQIGILKSIENNLNKILFNIDSFLEGEMFDDELEAAEYLLENNLYRPAGVLAAVVIERHLKKFAKTHEKTIPPKATLGQINEILKDTYEEPKHFLKIKLLNELRILCSHDKKKEPTKEDIVELIDGAKKVISTIF